MKIKILSVISVALALATMSVFVASAKDISAPLVDADLKAQLVVNATSSTKKANTTNTEAQEQRDQDKATTTSSRNSSSTSTKVDNKVTNTEANDNGQLNADSHRNTVALFVQSLLNIASREGGIGAYVRNIARKEDDSAATTSIAIAKIENRGALRTFLFGPDYQNLAVLRSELSTTQVNIDQLKTLLNTVNVQTRTELDIQIKLLEKEQAKINAYIQANESTFSLFGWMNK